MLLSRKNFVSAAAVAASGLALTASADAADTAPAAPAPVDERSIIKFHIVRPGQYNWDKMMATIATTAKNKQVLQNSGTTTIVPGVASVYLHMQNSMNAYEFSYPKSVGKLATLAVFMGPGIVFGLNDAMWTKYKLGDTFKLAPSNIYYHATSNLDLSAAPDDPKGIYQDWSAQAVLKRGGALMMCHNATMAIAGLVGAGAGVDPKLVLADFEKNTSPGFQMVPAGVAAVSLATAHGWGFFNI
jgi:hypothetical protein